MELVVLSGKGGTGKTTIATALSELANDVTRIDCDVEASNFYLYYDGKNLGKQDFYGGEKAFIDEEKCIKCGECQKICKFSAVKDFKIDGFACEGCGACTLVCPQNAIILQAEKSAELYITQLEQGIISRAEMDVGSDGSGKLVTQLRKQGREFSKNGELTIIDGSPGIGCSVIASITGSDAVLIVTEPTVSGLQDLKRVAALCKHFSLVSFVCLNKYDLNEEISIKIEKFIEEQQLKLVGKIPYDDTVIQSINELRPIIYCENSMAGKAIEEMWLNLKQLIFKGE